jgi:PAP2 superfamily
MKRVLPARGQVAGTLRRVVPDTTINGPTILKSLRAVAETPPVIIIAGMAIVAEAWNAYAGLRWQSQLPQTFFVISLFCFGIAAAYTMRRPNRELAELGLYTRLSFIYPVFGIKLTYLGIAAGWPLEDATFPAWDAALGFHWLHWAHFIASHPALREVQEFAYDRHYWQPLLSVIVLSFWGPRHRNQEFLTAILIALLITTVIASLCPAIGPADRHGLQTALGAVVMSLRLGLRVALPYMGIISFPSFHAAMAILFTIAHRGKVTFLPVLLLNLVMLSAISYSGDHYLVDLFSGGVAAGLSFVAATYAAGAHAGRHGPSAAG